MIEKTGTVKITEEGITISGFTFKGVTSPEGQLEACLWADKQLIDAMTKLKIGEPDLSQ